MALRDRIRLPLPIIYTVVGCMGERTQRIDERERLMFFSIKEADPA